MFPHGFLLLRYRRPTITDPATPVTAALRTSLSTSETAFRNLALPQPCTSITRSRSAVVIPVGFRAFVAVCRERGIFRSRPANTALTSALTASS